MIPHLIHSSGNVGELFLNHVSHFFWAGHHSSDRDLCLLREYCRPRLEFWHLLPSRHPFNLVGCSPFAGEGFFYTPKKANVLGRCRDNRRGNSSPFRIKCLLISCCNSFKFRRAFLIFVSYDPTCVIFSSIRHR